MCMFFFKVGSRFQRICELSHSTFYGIMERKKKMTAYNEPNGNVMANYSLILLNGKLEMKQLLIVTEQK